MSMDRQISLVKSYNEDRLVELQRIASPITAHFNIRFLTFRRLFPDGKIIHLSNDEKWLDRSFDNSYWQSTSSLKRIKTVEVDHQFTHVWDTNIEKADHVYQAMFDSNLWNGITLYDKRASYVDLWSFAADRQNTSALSFYANHMDIIKQFILYMHDQARHIIFPDNLNLEIETENTYSFDEEKAGIREKYLFEFSKYYYGPSANDYLTRSQFLCIYMLSCGQSVKEIACNLAVSPRTVESHLVQVKKKLGETCRSRLFEKAAYLLNMHK